MSRGVKKALNTLIGVATMCLGKDGSFTGSKRVMGRGWSWYSLAHAPLQGILGN